MVELLKLISKPKETPKITVQTIKTRSTVYPTERIDINDWYKYIALSNDTKKMVS